MAFPTGPRALANIVDLTDPLQRLQLPQEPQEELAQAADINWEAKAREIASSDANIFIDAESIGYIQRLLKLWSDYQLFADPLSPQKRELKRSYNDLETEFLSLCDRRFAPLRKQGEDFVVCLTIKEHAQAHADQIKFIQEKETVAQCRNEFNVPSMSASEVKRAYQACSQELLKVKKLGRKLSELVEKVKLPEPLQSLFRFDIRHGGTERMPCRITTTYLPMAYSIYELLHSLDIERGDFNAEQAFYISSRDLEKVIDHIEQIKLWCDDFSFILGDLLTSNPDDVASYYSLAKKPMQEVIRSPLRMTERVLARLPEFRESYILLFNQIGLDLTRHPERDLYKRLFENYYRLENMIGSNGLEKKFMEADPYVSILNVPQIKQICPHLNKQLVMQRLALDFTSARTWSEASATLRAFGIPSDLDLFKQNKVGYIQEMCFALVNPSVKPHLKKKSAELSRETLLIRQEIEKYHSDIQQIAQVLDGAASIPDLEQKSVQLCQRLLTQRTGLCLKASEPAFIASEAQMTALYRGEMVSFYNGGMRLKNIRNLLRSFREHPLVQEQFRQNAQFSHSLDFLEEDILRRLNVYYQMEDAGFYGRQVLNTAIEYLEQYVSSIVYAEESNVTADQLHQSLIVLVARCDAELRNCNEGFAGRIQDILLGLTTYGSNDSISSAIRQRLSALVKETFDRIALRSAQSSHIVGDKVDALKFIGEDHPRRLKAYAELGPNAKTMVDQALLAIDPFTVYGIAYDWVTDQFWHLNQDVEDEQIYQLLESLGFGSDREALDVRFRVNKDPVNRWQYAFFQQALPSYLINYLVRAEFLFIKESATDELYFQSQGTRPMRLTPDPRAGQLLAQAPQARVVQEAVVVRPQPQQQVQVAPPAAPAAPAAARRDDRAIGQVTQSALPSVRFSSS
jgi:hypothetical protein